MLNAKLVVVGGDAKTTEVRLRLPTVIGRGKEGVTLTLPHQLVSRKHTEIFEKDGQLFVRDLGSLNGTFVNNKRIEKEQLLKPNELLTLGNVTFRAVYECESDTQAAATETTETKPTDTKPAEKVATPPASAGLGAVIMPKKAVEEVKFEAVDDEIAEQASSPSAESNSEESKSVEAKAEPAEVKAVEEKPVASDESLADVLDDEADSADSGSKTDRSMVSDGEIAQESQIESSVFAFEEDTSKPNQSVSLSSLDGLPSGQPPQVSFVGNLDVENVGVTPEVESIELDLGEEKKSTDLNDSGLGSFLKKLPK